MSSEDDVLGAVDVRMNELTDIDTELRRLNAEKSARIKEIVDEYTPQVDPLTKRHETLVNEIGVLFQDHRSTLTGDASKTAILRHGTLSARTSKGSLVVENEAKAMAYIRRAGKLRRFTRVGKRTLNKDALKKDPAFVEKVPGISIDIPENLTIHLARTQIEIQSLLHPFRTRLSG